MKYHLQPPEDPRVARDEHVAEEPGVEVVRLAPKDHVINRLVDYSTGSQFDPGKLCAGRGG